MINGVDEIDLQTNRVGRISIPQRHTLHAKALGFILFGLILIATIAVPVIGLSLVTMIRTNQPFGTPAYWLPIIGLSFGVLLVGYVGLYAFAMISDFRAGWVAKDCGVVLLHARRTPLTLFLPGLYLRVGDQAYYAVDTAISRYIEMGRHYCVYYTPRTRTVVAVEPLDSRAVNTYTTTPAPSVARHT